MRFLFVGLEVCHPASFRFKLTMDALTIGYALSLPGMLGTFSHDEETPCSAHQEMPATNKLRAFSAIVTS